jgi:hypothetical protein
MAKVTLTISELVAEFGAYYKDRGQGQKDLIRMYSQADETTAIFTDSTTTDDQRVTKTTVTGGRIVQAFQKAFTPIGNAMTFKVNPIDLFHFKIDEQIDPDDIIKSWLGFMEGLPEVERKNWPLIRFIIDVHFKQQVIADIEENEIFRGEYLAPTTNTEGAVGRSMNGLRKIINDNITAGKISPLSMSVAIPPTDPEDFVEWCIEFVRKIDKKVVDKVGFLDMSTELGERFVDGMYARNNNFDKEPNLLKVPKTHVKIRGMKTAEGGYKLGLRSFQGSNKVGATIPGNAAIIRRNGRTSDRFEVQPFDRSVKLMADWWFGVGIWVPQYYYTNAADLTTLYA